MRSGGGIQANSAVTFANATLTARTNAVRLVDVGLSVIGPLDLSIVYPLESPGTALIEGFAAIEIGNMTCPVSAVWQTQF
jgi:hypothetical protein